MKINDYTLNKLHSAETLTNVELEHPAMLNTAHFIKFKVDNNGYVLFNYGNASGGTFSWSGSSILSKTYGITQSFYSGGVESLGQWITASSIPINSQGESAETIITTNSYFDSTIGSINEPYGLFFTWKATSVISSISATQASIYIQRIG
jgi:hypothetical protein